MNFFGTTLPETSGILLATWTPFLIGLTALGLIGLAASPRPPKWARLLAGGLGSVLLLWALWIFVFRPIFF